jgi:membrane peptidoglycan carboxypeptidase
MDPKLEDAWSHVKTEWAAIRRYSGRGLAQTRAWVRRNRWVHWLPVAVFLPVFFLLLATYLSIVVNFTHPANLVHANAGLEVYDREGNRIFDFSEVPGNKDIVPLSDISPHLINATVSTEDANFWNNPGVNFRGLLRAAWDNVAFWKHGGFFKGGGGSSISQQLAKNLYIPVNERQDRSLTRKVKEAFLAFELNRRYSKEGILTWYLNQLFYGNSAYGVEAASHRYFSKPAAELNLEEAAMLAGIPRAPAIYDPINNFEAAKKRQEQVIDLMARHDLISKDEAQAAKAVELAIKPGRLPSEARLADSDAAHFAVYVRELLPALIGDAARRPGLKVYTTLDSTLQSKGTAIVRQAATRLESQVGASNAALVAIDPTTGEILTMVGSRDYHLDRISGQVNNTTALNQPGSAIKPITYLAAFIKGWSPATIVEDRPITLGTGSSAYLVNNADGRSRGQLPVRQALGSSLNPPAVLALQYAGLEEVYNLARRMGLSTLGEMSLYGPAFTLGGVDVSLLDMTYAYSVLANGGEQAGIASVLEAPRGSRPLDPVAVLEVRDASGRTIYQHRPRKERIAPAAHVYTLTHVLADDRARQSMFGLNSSLRLPGREAAAKSGLTDNARDAWTIGYTPQLVAGVWVGNANNAPMRGATSTATASPIWRDFMVAALEGKPAVQFRVPEGVKFVQVCVATGLPPTSGCRETINEVFVTERAPAGPSANDRARAQPSPSPTPRVLPTPTPRPQPPRQEPERERDNSGPGRGRDNSGPGRRSSVGDFSGMWRLTNVVTEGPNAGQARTFNVVLVQEGGVLLGSGQGIQLSGTVSGSTAQVDFIYGQSGGAGKMVWTLTDDDRAQGTFTLGDDKGTSQLTFLD